MAQYTSDHDVLPNVPTATVKEFVRVAGKHMMKWAGEYYGANKLFHQEARVYVRTRRPGQRKDSSYGGISPSSCPYINILIVSGMQTWKPSYFYEYKHIASDDIIGDAPGVNWKEYAIILLAHEIAHTIDQCMYYEALFFDNMREVTCTHNYDDTNIADGHEWRWQSIYAVIRAQFFRTEFVDSIPLKTEDKRARNLNQPALGKVRIGRGCGQYRNQPVSGYYDLLREFKPHTGQNEWHKFGDGTVVIRTPKGQKMRVNVFSQHCMFTDK